MKACKNCKFWSLSVTEADPGVCRRYPPQATALTENIVNSAFSQVFAHGWCGEHVSANSKTR